MAPPLDGNGARADHKEPHLESLMLGRPGPPTPGIRRPEGIDAISARSVGGLLTYLG